MQQSVGSAFTLPEHFEWTGKRLAGAVWLFVAIGVLLRLVRFALNFPFWCDEYQLAANFLDRNFADLLRPLEHNQVAPLGFLAIELAAVRAFGFAEWTLRLAPFVCGIASLFVFRHVATRLLTGLPQLLAVAVFSISYYPIRHCVEVKPYAGDLLVSLIFLALFVEWQRDTRRTGWLWALMAWAPVGLSVSFPAAFVAGAVSLGVAYVLWSARDSAESERGSERARWLSWAGFNLIVAVSFLGLLKLSVSAQYSATQKEMVDCWSDAFPPWREPLELVAWLVRVHTSEMFAYPAGAENFGSIGSTLCFVAGLFAWKQIGRRDLLVVIAGCFALSLAAATIHRYPYGGHPRLSQYLAPFICLTGGLGAARLIQQLPWAFPRRALPRLAAALCIALGVGVLVRDLRVPWKDRLDFEHREFARTFWNAEPEIETLSVQTDLARRIYTGSFETPYLCNLRICSEQHRSGWRDGAEIVAAADRPLRCVVVHSRSAKVDESGLDRWLTGMQRHYDLVATDRQEVPVYPRTHPQAELYLLCYDSYRFVPKSLGSVQNPVQPASAEVLEETRR